MSLNEYWPLPGGSVGAGAAAIEGPGGRWQLRTGTTARGLAWVACNPHGSVHSLYAFAHGVRPIAVEWDVCIPAASESSEAFRCIFGYVNDPHAADYALAFRIEDTGAITCVVRCAGADVASLTRVTAVIAPAGTRCRFVFEHDGVTFRFLFAPTHESTLVELHRFPLASLPPEFASEALRVLARIQKTAGCAGRVAHCGAFALAAPLVPAHSIGYPKIASLQLDLCSPPPE